jgi:hypothetical protein
MLIKVALTGAKQFQLDEIDAQKITPDARQTSVLLVQSAQHWQLTARTFFYINRIGNPVPHADRIFKKEVDRRSSIIGVGLRGADSCKPPKFPDLREVKQVPAIFRCATRLVTQISTQQLVEHEPAPSSVWLFLLVATIASHEILVS